MLFCDKNWKSLFFPVKSVCSKVKGPRSREMYFLCRHVLLFIAKYLSHLLIESFILAIEIETEMYSTTGYSKYSGIQDTLAFDRTYVIVFPMQQCLHFCSSQSMHFENWGSLWMDSQCCSPTFNWHLII